jgi:hypothetical protein
MHRTFSQVAYVSKLQRQVDGGRAVEDIRRRLVQSLAAAIMDTAVEQTERDFDVEYKIAVVVADVGTFHRMLEDQAMQLARRLPGDHCIRYEEDNP